MNNAFAAIDTHVYYDEFSIALGFVMLFVFTLGSYRYVPNATPTTWKRYGVHIGVALALCAIILALPSESSSYGERTLQAGLAFSAITLGLSIVFATKRSSMRRERKNGAKSPRHTRKHVR